MKKAVHIVASELFQASLILYAVLLAAETFREGSVSSLFNTDYLFGLTAASAFATGLTRETPENPESRSLHTSDVWYLLFVAILGGIFVYERTAWLGILSPVAGAFSAVIIFIVSYLTLTDS